MDNWNKLARPPATALKTIGGGRLKGMTDVNPQWRYQAMTEVYGPCGIGWKFTIDRLWTEPGPEKEVMAFAHASLQVKNGDMWSDPIPGIGGSMLVAAEKSGLHCSDEAFKMAVTDALSVAMKMLGVAADIYMGRWDGSKYKEVPVEGEKKAHSATDGALAALSEPDQLKAKRVANSVVDLWAEEKPVAAYEQVYESGHTGEMVLAVWEILKPHSEIRSALKKMRADDNQQKVA